MDEFNRRLAEANRAAVELIRQEEMEQRGTKCKTKRKGKRRTVGSAEAAPPPHTNGGVHVSAGACEEVSIEKSLGGSDKSDKSESGGGDDRGEEHLAGKKGREGAARKVGHGVAVKPGVVRGLGRMVPWPKRCV